MKQLAFVIYGRGRVKITLGSSYWHNHYKMKVEVYYINRPYLYIVKDAKGDLHLAWEHELEELE